MPPPSAVAAYASRARVRWEGVARGGAGAGVEGGAASPREAMASAPARPPARAPAAAAAAADPELARPRPRRVQVVHVPVLHGRDEHEAPAHAAKAEAVDHVVVGHGRQRAAQGGHGGRAEVGGEGGERGGQGRGGPAAAAAAAAALAVPAPPPRRRPPAQAAGRQPRAGLQPQQGDDAQVPAQSQGGPVRGAGDRVGLHLGVERPGQQARGRVGGGRRRAGGGPSLRPRAAARAGRAGQGGQAPDRHGEAVHQDDVLLPGQRRQVPAQVGGGPRRHRVGGLEVGGRGDGGGVEEGGAGHV